MRISDWSSDVCSSDLQGIEISRATLANWVGRGIAALMPIVNRMRVDALARSRLFVDETTVKVLAPGTGKTKTGYMWVIVCDDRAHGGADPPLALYTYLDRKRTRLNSST